MGNGDRQRTCELTPGWLIKPLRRQRRSMAHVTSIPMLTAFSAAGSNNNTAASLLDNPSI